MKIAFLVKVIPPVINGIGEYTVHLAESLRAQGCDVQIFTSQDQRKSQEWIQPVISKWKGEEIVEKLKAFQPDWISLQYVPQLYSGHGISGEMANLPLYLKKHLQSKVAVTFHEFQSEWGLAPKKFLLAALLRLQTYQLMRGCDVAITTCEIYKKILQQFSSLVPVHSFPVGANILPSPLPKEKREELLIRHKTKPGQTFALFGRLSSFRNSELALTILAQAQKEGIPATLLLIGSMRSSNPNLFQKLQEKSIEIGISQSIVETGDLSPEEISAYLSITDVFLFPQGDGISTRNTTLMSAMAHGLPIISYAPRPGNFEPYEIPYGSFTKQGDEHGFVKNALHFMRQKTDSYQAELQKSYFESHFTWGVIAQSYRKALAGLQ